MKTARDYGYSYAVSINATDTKLQNYGDDIPEKDYLDMRRKGVVNIPEYWAGYNEYINETHELRMLSKEIKILKQQLHLCNCK